MTPAIAMIAAFVVLLGGALLVIPFCRSGCSPGRLPSGPQRFPVSWPSARP